MNMPFGMTAHLCSRAIRGSNGASFSRPNRKKRVNEGDPKGTLSACAGPFILLRQQPGKDVGAEHVTQNGADDRS